MTRHFDAETGQRLPEHALDALYDELSSYVGSNFELMIVNATTIKVPAGTENDQVAIAIEGRFRFRTTDITAAVPALPGAGEYEVFVTGSDNSYAQTPSPDTDNTDYNFGLEIRASGMPSTDISRMVGEIVWDGAAITGIKQHIGAAMHKTPGSVETLQLADGAVTTPKIADGAVTAPKLASGVVGTTPLADGSVTNAKLAPDAVTADKIAANAVGSSEIASGAVGTDEIATNGVGNAEIADGAVDSLKLAGGAVTNAKLAPDAVDAPKIAAGAVGTSELATDAVDASKIAAGAVGMSETADALVPPGLIAPYGGAAAPAGWLLCDGAAVSRTTFAALYAALGGGSSPWGQGNGSTTFNTPNLKGRIPFGLDAAQTEFDTRAETGGEKAHVLTDAESVPHSHSLQGHTHSMQGHIHTGATGPENEADANIQIGSGEIVSDANHTHNFATSGPSVADTGAPSTGATGALSASGAAGAHNTLPPYVVMHYIIKT